MYNVYRLAERLGYHHVEDFLDDIPNSAELTGMLAYLSADDEAQAYRRAHAIVRAFNGDGKKQAAKRDEDDEEIIDTTKPEFAEHFKGFINTRQPKPPQRQFRQMSDTQILMG